MSALSHQSAVNPDRNFWLSADGGGTIAYNTPLVFNISASNGNQAEIKGVNDLLYIEAPTGVVFNPPGIATPQNGFNMDSTAQNGLPGLYASTIIYAGDSFASGGYNGGAITFGQRDANNNPVGTFNMIAPKTSAGGTQPSTLQMFHYFNGTFNPLTSPVLTINPTIPRIDIPTYTVNASALTVSSINGIAPISARNDLTPTLGNFNVNNAVPTAIGEANFPNIIAGQDYLFDCGFEITAGSSIPANGWFQIGIRIGGNTGDFNYNNTFYYATTMGIPPAGLTFSVTGIATAGSTSSLVELICYQTTGGAVTLNIAPATDAVWSIKALP